MVCGILDAKVLDGEAPGSGQYYGCFVAEDALVKATLRHLDSISWDFFTNPVVPSLTLAGRPQARHLHLHTLSQQYEQRVHPRDISQLEQRANSNPYVLVTSAPGAAAIIDVRDRLGCSQVPVCGIMHSVFCKDMFATHTWLLLNLEEHDVVVVSSNAGRKAIERLWESLYDHMATYIGGSTKKRSRALPQIVEIPFGVDIPHEKVANKATARASLHLSEESFVVLYMGRLSEAYKADLDPLLLSVAELARRGNRISLILAGQSLDSQYEQCLGQLLVELGLTDSTLVISNFKEDLKGVIFAAADVFVSPADSIQETFGIAILEAMAHGLPVIASSWSGYRETVLDGVTGLLLKSGILRRRLDAASSISSVTSHRSLAHYLAQGTIIDVEELTVHLETFIQHPELACVMGSEGRRRIREHYGWAGITRTYYDLWSSQIVSGQPTIPRRVKKYGIAQTFAQYADTLIENGDLVTSSDISSASGVGARWLFHKPSQAGRIDSLIALCNTTMSIDELLAAGFSTSEVLFVLKKGLCKLVRTHL